MHRFRKQHEPVAAMHAARKAVAEEEQRAGAKVEDPWKVPFDKKPMQEALCEEQGYLCAYCGQPIKPDGASMNIEHWTPRAKDPEQALQWGNLLGVCLGTYRGPRTRKIEVIVHCDKSRRPKALLVHHPVELPLGKLVPFQVELKGASPYEVGIRTENDLISYMREPGNRLRGWLSAEQPPVCHSDPQNPPGACVAYDISELNLNALKLVNDRATVIERLWDALADHAGTEPAFIQKRLQAATAPGTKLPAYAHIELAYLQKKARRHNLHIQ